MQYNPEIRAFFRATAKRKTRKVARTLVAVELARIVYHVLRTGEPFNGQFKKRPLKRTKKLQWPAWQAQTPHGADAAPAAA